jgi:glycosyltransferase involved in cell wall biosynthesis
MTDPLGQGQVLSYLSGLALKGYTITLISFEKPDRFLKDRDTIQAICTKAGIQWMPLSYTKSPPVFSTLYDIRRMLGKAKQLHRKQKFDIVHCRGYISAMAGLQLKRKYGIRFIFDMRGFWIDEKSEGEGGWNPSSPVYSRVIRYLRKKEHSFYIESDHIVTLTRAAAREIAGKYPELQQKITVIPTCVNLSLFGPFNTEDRDAVRKKLGIPTDAFVLLYSGGIGQNYDTGFLLNVFTQIKLIHPDAWLLILSKDNIQLTALAGVPNVVSVSVPYRDVAGYLMAGDWGVINYVMAASVSGRSPTKLGEYWACGLPAIAPAGIGDVDQLFSDYPQSGIVVKKGDLSVLNKQTIQPTDKTQLRNYASAYFGLENGIGAYDKLYRSLINKTNT